MLVVSYSSKHQLDPFRAIIGVVAIRKDADLFISVATSAGLQFDLAVPGAYVPGKTRIAALLPRVLAAYDELGPSEQLLASRAALKGIGPVHWETRKRAELQLGLIGWQVLDDGLVVASLDVREMFFPPGSPWDALVVLRGVFAEAKQTLTIVDAYASGTIFPMLVGRPLDALQVEILCSKYAAAVAAEGRTFKTQHNLARLDVRQAADFHDRFVVIDGTSCAHVGASIKDAGRTAFMVSRVEDPANLAAILQTLQHSWAAATPVA